MAKDKLVKEFEANGAVKEDVDLLVRILMKYDVNYASTELVNYDTSNARMLNGFIATKRIEGKSEKTLIRYSSQIKHMLDDVGVRYDKITTNHLRFYLSELKDKGLSNRTLDGMRKVYSSFFTWLNNEGFINKNPCGSLNAIKFKKEQKKPFSSVEMMRIKEACHTVRDIALVEFLYSTGCRVSEVSGLNIDDVDFEHQTVEVLGKGNKVRTVYLSDIALVRLKQYLNERQDTSPAIFVGQRSDRIKDNGIRAILKRIEKNCGVENIHPHRFRRSLATDLLNRGMKIERVAEILGHENLETTRIYTYINKEDVRQDFMKNVV